MKLFHGWRMAAAGASMQFLQAGLLQQAFGAYLAVLTEERGWSKTSLSGAAAMQSMEAAAIGPLLGWIIDRFGSQGMIRIGVIALGAGFMLLSQIDSLGGFYGAFIVIALGSSMCGFFPVNVALIHWFEKRRARALSTLTLGLALGGIFVPAVAWAMQNFGWRATAFGSGLIIWLACWPLTYVFRHRHPQDIGEVRDGHASAATAGAEAAHSTQREFSAREALRTRSFWLLSLGHGFALLVVMAVNVHAIAHMKEGLGYSLEEASLVITLVTLSQVGGVLLGWAIGDRFEKRFVSAACMLMHSAGLLMLTFASSPAMLVAFALLHGGAWGLRGPLMQAIRADYFGRQSIGMILGLSSLIVVIGQAGGPLIAGAFADITGNYISGFTVLSIMAGLGSLFFLLARRPV